MSASLSSESPGSALAPILANDLAEHCLRAVGPGRVRLVGDELASLKPALLLAGCEVELSSEASPDGWPADMVVVWAVDSAQRGAALDVKASFLVLAADAQWADELPTWGQQAGACGWQWNPAAFTLHAPSEELSVLMLARDGVTVADDGALFGVSCHGLAATLVRPGDAVLAPGAAEDGIWRVIQQHSRCSWLGVITDRSPPPVAGPGMLWTDRAEWERSPRDVDTVIIRPSYDVDGGRWELGGFDSVLVRSGRLVLVVPLVPGCDTDVHALVATVERAGLIVDRGWLLDPARPLGLGQFAEVQRNVSGHLLPGADEMRNAVAMVLMAVKIEGPGMAQDPSLQSPNIIAFQRDYVDASVVRLIVVIGLRLESVTARRYLARRIMAQAPPRSADYGAALCVLLYDPVALEGHHRRELLNAAERFIRAPAINATALRWQVSLAFVAGSLHQQEGDLATATAFYEKVLEFDVLKFSALLGTKTTTAALRLGWIHFAKGRLASARQAWLQGFQEARRLAADSEWSETVGSLEAPETFAMPEFAAVMDEAGGIAAALRLTAETPLRPGLAWQWANRTWQKQLTEARAEQLRQGTWLERLQKAKDWLDGQYHNQGAELSRREEVILGLESARQALSEDNAGMRAAFRLAHQHAVAEAAALQDRIQLAQVAHQQQQDVHEELRREHEQQSMEHARQLARYAQLSSDHEQLLAAYDAQSVLYMREVAAHQHLVAAAQLLSDKTGVIMGRASVGAVPAESIAEEMSRLSIALDRLPAKPLVRVLLRALSSLLGKK